VNKQQTSHDKRQVGELYITQVGFNKGQREVKINARVERRHIQGYEKTLSGEPLGRDSFDQFQRVAKKGWLNNHQRPNEVVNSLGDICCVPLNRAAQQTTPERMQDIPRRFVDFYEEPGTRDDRAVEMGS
jgi:hypothetical protein